MRTIAVAITRSKPTARIAERFICIELLHRSNGPRIPCLLHPVNPRVSRCDHTHCSNHPQTSKVLSEPVRIGVNHGLHHQGPERRNEHHHAERHFLRRGRTQSGPHVALPRGGKVAADHVPRLWPKRSPHRSGTPCVGDSAGRSHRDSQRKPSRMAYGRYRQPAAGSGHCPPLHDPHCRTNGLRAQ